jgi:hypothetical protein
MAYGLTATIVAKYTLLLTDLPTNAILPHLRWLVMLLPKIDFKPCLHWQRLLNNAGDSDSHYLLALTTLDNATKIGLFLFLVTLPKVPRQVQ